MAVRASRVKLTLATMKRSSLLRYAGIGILTGGSDAVGPSLLADQLRKACLSPTNDPSSRTRAFERGLRMLARLERYEGGARPRLLAVAKAAVSAGSISAAERRSWLPGATLGALAAMLAGSASGRLRRELVRKLGLDPAVVSALESRLADAVEREVRDTDSSATVIDIEP